PLADICGIRMPHYSALSHRLIILCPWLTNSWLFLYPTLTSSTSDIKQRKSERIMRLRSQQTGGKSHADIWQRFHYILTAAFSRFPHTHHTPSAWMILTIS